MSLETWKHYPTGVEVYRSGLTGAVYVRLSHREIVRTKCNIVPGVNADLDLDGNIVGLTVQSDD